jgi:hypothetical protein
MSHRRLSGKSAEKLINFDYINITKMISVEAQVREWGRSLGVVLPKEIVAKEGISKDDKVSIIIGRRSDALRKTFGTLKFSKSTERLLHESDKEAWDE